MPKPNISIYLAHSTAANNPFLFVERIDNLLFPVSGVAEVLFHINVKMSAWFWFQQYISVITVVALVFEFTHLKFAFRHRLIKVSF